ncbi:hypothetical protein CAEBREN_17319 [Caenorhabditis brenneri]|uniref:Uncharacterized protein n=1 Tax=Caenorhabditis brenneri TaxID=135651 RepID=G0MQY9_CAEBE|nr:hypothetical protein CAEBREN_17319 [Caenorhabditis brenneri]
MSTIITKEIEIIDLTGESSDEEDSDPEVITLSSDSESESDECISSEPPSPSISICLDVTRREWETKTPLPTKDCPDWEIQSEEKIPLSSDCVTPRIQKSPKVRDIFAGCQKQKHDTKPRRNLAKELAKNSDSGVTKDNESQKAIETSIHDIPSTSDDVTGIAKRNRKATAVMEPVEEKPKRMCTRKSEVQEPSVPTKCSKKASNK